MYLHYRSSSLKQAYFSEGKTFLIFDTAHDGRTTLTVWPSQPQYHWSRKQDPRCRRRVWSIAIQQLVWHAPYRVQYNQIYPREMFHMIDHEKL